MLSGLFSVPVRLHSIDATKLAQHAVFRLHCLPADSLDSHLKYLYQHTQCHKDHLSAPLCCPANLFNKEAVALAAADLPKQAGTCTLPGVSYQICNLLGTACNLHQCKTETETETESVE